MFKQPVWTFDLIRDTDAPFERVLAGLMDGPRYGTWHPVCKFASPELTRQSEDQAEVHVVCHPFPGVTERSHFQIRAQGSRVLLVYTTQLKGWPVPLLLGWWRLERRDLWERFVRAL